MSNAPSLKVSFDYDSLPEDFAGALAMTAERIRKRARQVSTDIIEIGRELLAVKSELEHGQFLAWINAEFSWSERSAQYFMSIAAEWGDLPPATVADLPIKLLRDLSSKSVPTGIKANVRADVEAGRPVDVKAVQRQIREATKADRAPAAPSVERRGQQAQLKQEPDVEQVEAERKAAAVEIADILCKLPEADIERLLELLELFKTALLWQVRELVSRRRP